MELKAKKKRIDKRVAEFFIKIIKRSRNQERRIKLIENQIIKLAENNFTILNIIQDFRDIERGVYNEEL